jgi:hypothetical protein
MVIAGEGTAVVRCSSKADEFVLDIDPYRQADHALGDEESRP